MNVLHSECGMEWMETIIRGIFDISSIWSIVARGAVWFIIAAVIIASTDTPHPEQNGAKLKQNLGFLLLFLVLSGTLLYLLFGYTAHA